MEENLTRPGWQEWFMMLARVTSLRGSCRRKRVGAILVRDSDKHIVSGGYNGAPRGMPDCLEVGCDLREINGKMSCFRTVHAESNALDRAAQIGMRAEAHTFYCTVIPCRDCALRIIQNGWIKTVVYEEHYLSRSTEDVEALFAGTDKDTVDFMTRRFGEAWTPKRRVVLIQVPTP